MATSATPLVATASDLTSMVTPEMMEAFDSAGEESSSVATASDATPEPESIDTPDPIGDEPEPELDEPLAAAEEELPEVKAEEPKAPAATEEEELPEGVVAGKNRRGEDGVFVSKDRWQNTIYANHKLVQQASDILGEPLTVESLQLRNEALLGQERLFTDLNSGDPETQGRVVDYFLDEMAGARQRGEVGVDPAVGMAQAFYSKLREKSPDAFAGLRFNAARDLVGEMFKYAAQTGDKPLFQSTQHLARALAQVGHNQISDVSNLRSILERSAIPFYTADEMEGLARGNNDPTAQLRAENQQLKEQLNGKSATSQTEQFATWRNSVRDAKDAAINQEALTPALTSVAAAWAKHPAEYKELVTDRLQKQVSEVIAKDPAFQSRVKLFVDQAQRATSQAYRDQIASQLQKAYVQRAKLAAEAVKRPILKFAAETLKQRSETTRDRRQAGQSRTALQNGSPVNRSPLPTDLGKMPGGVYDPALAMKQATALFS